VGGPPRPPDALARRDLRDLFAEDPVRGETMVAEAGDLVLDYSKNRLTHETITLLVALAERAGLRERTERCSAASASTSRRTGRCCTWRCGRRARR